MFFLRNESLNDLRRYFYGAVFSFSADVINFSIICFAVFQEVPDLSAHSEEKVGLRLPFRFHESLGQMVIVWIPSVLLHPSARFLGSACVQPRQASSRDVLHEDPFPRLIRQKPPL